MHEIKVSYKYKSGDEIYRLLNGEIKKEKIEYAICTLKEQIEVHYKLFVEKQRWKRDGPDSVITEKECFDSPEDAANSLIEKFKTQESVKLD